MRAEGKRLTAHLALPRTAPTLEPRVLHPSDHPLQSGQTRTALPFQGSQLALFPWLDQDFQSRAGPPTPRVQGTQLTSDIRAVCDLFHKKENKGHADPQGPSEHAALPCQRSNSPCQHMLVVNSQESRGQPPSILTQAPAPGPQGRKTMETNGEIQDVLGSC